MFGQLGTTELIIILVIVLIIFGAGRLPGVFRAVGQGIKEFRDASKDKPQPEDQGNPGDEQSENKRQ